MKKYEFCNPRERVRFEKRQHVAAVQVQLR
jgi:hypothetical protein